MNKSKLPKTEEDAVAFLQQRNILPRTRRCTNGHDMKMYFRGRIFWQCNKRSCNEKVAIRKGNWFEGSNLAFHKALEFIYDWCHEETSIVGCHRELGMSKNVVVDWNSYMREICALDMASRINRKIGGPGRIVWR